MAFWEGAGGALVSSAMSLAGGLLSRPNHSQRDLMYIQNDIWGDQMRRRYPLQVGSLKKAGLNPILAVSQPPPAAGAGPAPQPYADPVGKAVSEGASSALSAFMAMHQKRQIEADTELKEAQADTARADAALKTAQTETEGTRPGSVLAQTARDYAAAQHSSALTAHEQQKMGKTMIEMAIAKEELTIAEKDAIIAAIDVDLYRSTVGEVARTLQQLGFSAGAARGLGAGLLKLFGVGGRSARGRKQ